MTATLLAFGAAVAAGALNAVAGGGTLVSFPTLIWLGLQSTIANATNTVAIVGPASLGGMWGFRRELKTATLSVLVVLVAPSVFGGVAGAVLLRLTPTPVFDRIVPLLILFATLLFMAQGVVQQILPANPGGFAAGAGTGWVAGAILFQFCVGVYGGYFGAGMGIVLLATLGALGMRDIHEMNALKNLLTFCINSAAAVYFVSMQMVSWPHAAIMMLGAAVGSVAAAAVTRRLNRQVVRGVVIAIGLFMATSLFLRR